MRSRDDGGRCVGSGGGCLVLEVVLVVAVVVKWVPEMGESYSWLVLVGD